MKTSELWLHIISALIACVGVILAIGDTITNIPGLNPTLVHAWPTVFFLATIVDRVGKVLLNYLSPKAVTMIALFIGASAFMVGCATNTGDPVKDARGRATNQALVEAATVLGNFAANSLYAAAQQEMQTGKVDWGNAATTGLYANSTSILNSGQIQRVVNAYTGNNLPQTAQAAATAFNSSNADPNAKTQAIAAVISTAAGAPPANVKLDPFGSAGKAIVGK